MRRPRDGNPYGVKARKYDDDDDGDTAVSASYGRPMNLRVLLAETVSSSMQKR